MSQQTFFETGTLNYMLWAIVKKELLHNVLTARIAICYAIIVVLIFTSALIRGLQYKHDFATYDKDQAAAAQEYARDDKESEFDGYLWYRHVQLAPRAVGIFCQGFDQTISRAFGLDVSIYFNFLDEVIDDRAVFRIFKVYDTSFVIAIIVGLLALFIGFDCISGEWEQGTLKLVLTNQVSRGTFLIGKFLGGWLAVVWPVVCALAASLVWLMAVMQITFTTGDLVRLALFTGLAALYLGVCVLISLTSSILCRRSSPALLCSILVWMLVTLVMPYGMMAAADQVRPVATFGKLLQRYTGYDAAVKEQRSRTINPLRRQLRDGLLKQDAFDWAQQEAFMDYFSAVYNRQVELVQEQLNNIEGQARWARLAVRLAAPAAFLVGSADLAGTGLTELFRTTDWKHTLTVENRKSHVQEYLRRHRMYRHLTLAEAGDKLYRKHDFDKSTIPKTDYRATTAGDALVQVLPEVLVLILEALLLFLCALYLFVTRDRIR